MWGFSPLILAFEIFETAKPRRFAINVRSRIVAEYHCGMEFRPCDP
jgi:hypothetical protein